MPFPEIETIELAEVRELLQTITPIPGQIGLMALRPTRVERTGVGVQTEATPDIARLAEVHVVIKVELRLEAITTGDIAVVPEVQGRTEAVVAPEVPVAIEVQVAVVQEAPAVTEVQAAVTEVPVEVVLLREDLPADVADAGKTRFITKVSLSTN